MKVWVPKQREVKEVVIITAEAAANSDGSLNVGDLQVTDADGRTRIYTPNEFAERFEEIEKNSWPGYLKRRAGNIYTNGTLMVGFQAADLSELIFKMNTWAQKAENRHLILADNGDHYWTGADGKVYAVMYVYSQTEAESQAHLDERAAVEKEVNEKWEEKKRQLGIDERNALEKAAELRAAAEAIERTKRRELETLAAAGKHCQANHGKKMKEK